MGSLHDGGNGEATIEHVYLIKKSRHARERKDAIDPEANKYEPD